jgi:hypothetical protein
VCCELEPQQVEYDRSDAGALDHDLLTGAASIFGPVSRDQSDVAGEALQCVDGLPRTIPAASGVPWLHRPHSSAFSRSLRVGLAIIDSKQQAIKLALTHATH